MQETNFQLNLTDLQRRLDGLLPGDSVTLGIADVRRLFGLNDVGQARVENFAEGHHCRIEATPSTVTFRKAAAG